MSNELIVEFVGFESAANARVYSFVVRQASTEPRDFTPTISNQAFTDHLISFQDGPDICSRKLRHELAANGNQPSETRLNITDTDLEDYRSMHAPRKASRPFARKPLED